MIKLSLPSPFERTINRICSEEATAKLLAQLKLHHEVTYTHSLRVAHYTFEIATLMGIPEEDKKLLTRSVLFHDIGKLGIMPSLLDKTTMLTRSEYDLIKKHPQFGMHYVNQIRVDRDVILLHHENINGTGYPFGLRAPNLSTSVRIVRIADSFDAMTSSRGYNKVKTIQEARAELHNGKYGTYCPNTLSVFDKFLESKHLAIV